MPTRLATLIACGLAACLPDAARAKDYFLTVGGGHSPRGNQVSIERNVAFQQRVLSGLPGGAPDHYVLFADGDNRRPDVQYREDERDASEAERLMSLVFGRGRGGRMRYRNHELDNVAGPSDPELLNKRLGALAQELRAGDRLVLYVTAHGGSAPDEDEDDGGSDAGEPPPERTHNEFDTSIYFWDRKSLAASDFSRMLDQLPPDVGVVMVMVQCYAGGFAHTIFCDADAENGLAAHNRCGFFAQRHDLPAAGCTPGVDESEYQEYSSFFWAALGGQTRTGEAIAPADYDGDGRVSFAEAHSYSIIESDTIDIPVRTTGAFLREYSALGTESSREHGVLPMSGPVRDIGALATSDERAVLAGLLAHLDLGDDATVDNVRRRTRELRRERARVDDQLSDAARDAMQHRRDLREALDEAWPDLGERRRGRRARREILRDEPEKFVELVRAHPSYETLLAAEERSDELEDEQQAARHKEVKVKRLLRTIENIVLAANLPNVATAEIVARFERLRAMEEGSLAGGRPVTVATPRRVNVANANPQ